MLKRLSLVCNTAFYKAMNLATAVKELARVRDASMEDFVQGLSIQVSHESRTTTIKSLLKRNARQHRVPYKGRETTVENYFLQGQPNLYFPHKTHPLYPDALFCRAQEKAEPLESSIDLHPRRRPTSSRSL